MSTIPIFKTILYATDLGEHTRPVFRTALSIARKYEADIIMLHVVEPMSSALQAVVDTYLTEVDAKKVYKDGMKSVLSVMKQRLETFCQEELGSSDLQSGRVKELFVVSGQTSEEIIRVAEDQMADLIIIGKSTSHVLGTEVAGSAARRVSRHSTVPVMIVPNYSV